MTDVAIMTSIGAGLGYLLFVAIDRDSWLHRGLARLRRFRRSTQDDTQ